MFSKWLKIPDDGTLDFVFGVFHANRLGGDPVWGGIVGAPGDGKTEILRTLDGHPSIYSLTNLTAKTLVSGLPSYVAVGHKEPSLFPKLVGKVLVIKDLTTLISGPTEARDAVFGQLRDAYDGYTSASFGTGETKRFDGKFGMLFGVTTAIESTWSVINSLGERFLYFRRPSEDNSSKVLRAVEIANDKDQMRAELGEAAKRVLEIRHEMVPVVSNEMVHECAAIADFAATCRTPIKRGRKGEAASVPVPEVGTRLAGQLIQLARGIAIARSEPTVGPAVMKTIRYVALSGIPHLRLRVIGVLANATSAMKTVDIAAAIRMNSGSTKRALDDLCALGMVDQVSSPTNGYKWEPSIAARDRIKASRFEFRDELLAPPPENCPLTVEKMDDQVHASTMPESITGGDE